MGDRFVNLWDDSVNLFDNTTQPLISSIGNNDILVGVITIFIILYAGLVAPQLPEPVAQLLDSFWVQGLILFAIAYSATQRPSIAVVSVIAFLITLNVIERMKERKVLSWLMQREAMESVNGNGGELEEVKPTDEECVHLAGYQDSFYPQYVNMKPFAYQARYNANGVDGYDPYGDYNFTGYNHVDQRSTYGSNGGGSYDGNRSSYN